MKFSVGRPFDLPDLRGVVGQSVRQPEQTFRTAYYDTPDLRLWGRGVSFRFRGRAEGGTGTWTVKLPEPRRGATLDRREISWSGVADEVPAPARDMLHGLIRRADLDQVVAMETTRLSWMLHDHAGHEWAELDFDDVTVSGGPQDGLRYRQIEIERTGGWFQRPSLIGGGRSPGASGRPTGGSTQGGQGARAVLRWEPPAQGRGSAPRHRRRDGSSCRSRRTRAPAPP